MNNADYHHRRGAFPVTVLSPCLVVCGAGRGEVSLLRRQGADALWLQFNCCRCLDGRARGLSPRPLDLLSPAGIRSCRLCFVFGGFSPQAKKAKD